jgi:hypothetical protein
MGGRARAVTEDDLPEDVMLSDEAKADAAPVAELNYQRRKPWKPWAPGCIGFIVNSERPVAFLKWPKRRSKKDKA